MVDSGDRRDIGLNPLPYPDAVATVLQLPGGLCQVAGTSSQIYLDRYNTRDRLLGLTCDSIGV